MDAKERQSKIMAEARARGQVMVDDLARMFDVTTQTIRRDINDLCASGQLSRVHGGAVLATSISNLDYTERRLIAESEKRAIGARVAQMIPDGCSMFLNIGTTVEQVAAALQNKRDLVVVTNNINIVQILAGSADKEIILTGGVVRQSDGAVVGESAMEFIKNFKVDFAVIGASALDEDGTVTDYDIREVAVSKAIIANSRETFLACDATKFSRNAPVRICEISEIDTFVTDRTPPPAFADVCDRHDVSIIVAEQATDD